MMIYNHHFKATYTVEVTSCILFFLGGGDAKARPVVSLSVSIFAFDWCAEFKIAIHFQMYLKYCYISAFLPFILYKKYWYVVF